MSTTCVAHAESTQPPPNSAKSSPSSDTRVNEKVESRESRVKRLDDSNKKSTLDSRLSTLDSVAACMATAVELEKARTLVAALETENRSLTERLTTEKAATAILTELNETRRSESAALKNTISAKNETIAAKDAVIASQDKLVEALKKKKTSPWRRIGDILIGAAAITIFK